MKTFHLSTAAMAVALGLTISVAHAQGPSDFYKDKDIRLLISHPAGGGYDAYGRFLAQHLPRFLPGHPNIIPQNMPGAAGVIMANSMASQQDTDGTVIGLGPGAIATADLLNASGARFDARKLSWIGSMNSDVGVSLAWHTSSVKTVSDLMRTELIVGGGGVTDQSVVAPTALNNVLDTKFKIIPGYRGSAATSLAMERGETQGVGGMNFSSIKANRPDWLAEGKINILVQLSLEPHPDLPKIPTILDLSKTDEQRKILELVFAPAAMGRAVFGPPGIPTDRLTALRSAFDAMVKDKQFLADAEKLRIEINQPMAGEKIEALVTRLYETDAKTVAKAATAMGVVRQ